MKMSRSSNSSAEREPGCLGEQQIEHGSAVCYFDVVTSNHMLGYVSKGIVSRLREGITPRYASA